MTSIIKVDQIQTAAGATPTAGDLGINTTGTVLKVSHFTNNTNTSLSAVNPYSLWSGINVIKSVSNSKLIITGQLCFRGGSSYFMGEYWRIGNSGYRYDGIIQHGYASDADDRSVQFGWTINAEFDTTQTGSLAVDIGWNSANGNSQRPGFQWNPNNGDDNRIQSGKGSSLTIFEVSK
jgi:hypothetical protein